MADPFAVRDAAGDASRFLCLPGPGLQELFEAQAVPAAPGDPVHPMNPAAKEVWSEILKPTGARDERLESVAPERERETLNPFAPGLPGLKAFEEAEIDDGEVKPLNSDRDVASSSLLDCLAVGFFDRAARTGGLAHLLPTGHRPDDFAQDAAREGAKGRYLERLLPIAHGAQVHAVIVATQPSNGPSSRRISADDIREFLTEKGVSAIDVRQGLGGGQFVAMRGNGRLQIFSAGAFEAYFRQDQSEGPAKPISIDLARPWNTAPPDSPRRAAAAPGNAPAALKAGAGEFLGKLGTESPAGPLRLDGQGQSLLESDLIMPGGTLAATLLLGGQKTALVLACLGAFAWGAWLGGKILRRRPDQARANRMKYLRIVRRAA